MSGNPYQSPAAAATELAEQPAPGQVQPGIGVLISNVAVGALPGLAIGAIVAPLLPPRIAAWLGPFGLPDENPLNNWIGLVAAIGLATIQLGIMRARRHGMLTALGLAYVLAALISPLLPAMASLFSMTFVPRFELSFQLTVILACPFLLSMGIAIQRFGKRLRLATEAPNVLLIDRLLHCGSSN